MAEDVARAVGAKSPDVVTIAGKECQPRPLTVKELTELERECLTQYKREFIRTFSDNSDLLPEEDRRAILKDKMDEAARWDLTDLPQKWAYDASSVVLSSKMEKYLKEERGVDDKQLGETAETVELAKKRIVATLLDDGSLSEDKYEKLAGTKPRKGRVGYVEWWVTGSMNGMVSMIWKSFQDQGITREDVAREIGRNTSLMASLSREIESLTVPQVGNQ